jgi:hypothetical protein
MVILTDKEIEALAEEKMQRLEQGDYRDRRPNSAKLYYGEIENRFSKAIRETDPTWRVFSEMPW